VKEKQKAIQQHFQIFFCLMQKIYMVILATALAWIMSGMSAAQAQTFTPDDVIWTTTGNLNVAVNEALRDWEVQYGKAPNYLGSVNVNLAQANDIVVAQMHNAIRAAVHGKTLGTYTFNTPQLTGIEVILNNFGNNWKAPRRIQQYDAGCDDNVHLMDTSTVFSCTNPRRSPIAQWKKFGIVNPQAAFDGESNVEMWLNPGDGQTQNFLDATWFGIYAWWFFDSSANWGHLVHMLRSASQKIGYSVFFVDPNDPNGDAHVAAYMWTAKAAIVLPIELISFTARNAGEVNQLQWATASEKNNDRFEIERSDDGQNWEVISEKAGAGDSQQRLEYSYDDKNPLDGVSYYRLRQVDFDGQFSFSPVRQVTRAKNLLFSASPNPTTDLVSFSGLPDDESDWSITITDASGRLVTIAANTTAIDLSAQPTGLYIATITTATGLQNLRLVKE
jgi:DNA/RNA endonuclease YhcR with UshA esterase domain